MAGINIVPNGVCITEGNRNVSNISTMVRYNAGVAGGGASAINCDDAWGLTNGYMIHITGTELDDGVYPISSNSTNTLFLANKFLLTISAVDLIANTITVYDENEEGQIENFKTSTKVGKTVCIYGSTDNDGLYVITNIVHNGDDTITITFGNKLSDDTVDGMLRWCLQAETVSGDTEQVAYYDDNAFNFRIFDTRKPELALTFNKNSVTLNRDGDKLTLRDNNTGRDVIQFEIGEVAAPAVAGPTFIVAGIEATIYEIPA